MTDISNQQDDFINEKFLSDISPDAPSQLYQIISNMKDLNSGYSDILKVVVDLLS